MDIPRLEIELKIKDLDDLNHPNTPTLYNIDKLVATLNESKKIGATDVYISTKYQDAVDGYDMYVVQIRFENDTEYNQRVKEKETHRLYLLQRAAKKKIKKEEKDKADYERLKTKYGDTVCKSDHCK